LALRNFLVGYQMTLADALLVSTVAICFELALDKKTRDNSLQNLGRYTGLILKMAPCARVFGTVVFCKEVAQPNFAFDFKAAAAAKKAAAQAKDAPVKEAKAKGGAAQGGNQQQD